MKRKEDKKKIGNIVLFAFIYIGLLALLIVGITYAALNIEQFNMYNTLVKVWNENSGASSPNFDDYLNEYNNVLVPANSGWVKAEKGLFLMGISFIILSLILASITIFLHLKVIKNGNIFKKKK